jgi:hypothetical protein
MVKVQTQYLTRAGRPFYYENGEFYLQRFNGTGWRRASNEMGYFRNNNYLGSILGLKRRRNRAARTIQRFERGRASRKRTAFAHSAFGRALPNNLVQRILR